MAIGSATELLCHNIAWQRSRSKHNGNVPSSSLAERSYSDQCRTGSPLPRCASGHFSRVVPSAKSNPPLVEHRSLQAAKRSNRTHRFKACLLREPQRGKLRPRVYAPSSTLYIDARLIFSTYAISVALGPQLSWRRPWPRQPRQSAPCRHLPPSCACCA